MKVAAAIAGSFALLVQAALPQGTVRGHVYTTTGQPIQGAVVIANALDFAHSGPTPFTHTDAWGQYSLVIPFSGNVNISATIHASKRPGFPLFSVSLPARNSESIEIKSGHRLVEVNLRLTPSDPAPPENFVLQGWIPLKSY